MCLSFLWVNTEGLMGWNIYGDGVVDESRGSHEGGYVSPFILWGLGMGPSNGETNVQQGLLVGLLEGVSRRWGCCVWLILRASTRRYLRDIGSNIGRISMKGLIVLLIVFGEEEGVSWIEVSVSY
jgi:hypothetical protein